MTNNKSTNQTQITNVKLLNIYDLLFIIRYLLYNCYLIFVICYYFKNKGAIDVKISKTEDTITITFQTLSLFTFFPNILICFKYLINQSKATGNLLIF